MKKRVNIFVTFILILTVAFLFNTILFANFLTYASEITSKPIIEDGATQDINDETVREPVTKTASVPLVVAVISALLLYFNTLSTEDDIGNREVGYNNPTSTAPIDDPEPFDVVPEYATIIHDPDPIDDP